MSTPISATTLQAVTRSTPGMVCHRVTAGFKRGDPLVDLRLDALDPLTEGFPFVQILGQQKAMMISDPSFQGPLQFRNLTAQPPRASSANRSGSSWPRDDRLQHLPPGHPQRVRSHRTQLEIGLLQQLLDAIGHPVLALSQLRPVPRQVAQILDGRRRHEAPLQQPVLQQVGDPLAVLGVGLAPRHRFDVLRIHQHLLKLPLQHRPHRPPVDRRSLPSPRALPPVPPASPPAPANRG